MRTRPTTLDAVVYGHLAVHYHVPLPTARLRAIMASTCLGSRPGSPDTVAQSCPPLRPINRFPNACCVPAQGARGLLLAVEADGDAHARLPATAVRISLRALSRQHALGLTDGMGRARVGRVRRAPRSTATSTPPQPAPSSSSKSSSSTSGSKPKTDDKPPSSEEVVMARRRNAFVAVAAAAVLGYSYHFQPWRAVLPTFFGRD